MASEFDPRTASDCLKHLYAVLECLDHIDSDAAKDAPSTPRLAAIHVQQAIDLIHTL